MPTDTIIPAAVAPLSVEPAVSCRHDSFWAGFFEHAWEKQPVLYRGAGAGVLDERQVFSAVLAACDAYRRDPGPKRVNFYIDDRVEAGPAPLLPRASDGSAAGYHQRMAAQLGGRDYTLLVADPHAYDPVVWRAACRLLDLHYARAGHPAQWPGWVDTAVFLGRYRRTPFGVHEGPMDVMTFPLIGTKRFRTWSPRYVARRPEIKDRRDYDEHLADSGLLEATVGDITYWPASTFHIAEGGEEFTMAWSLGLWRNQAARRPARLVGDVVRSLLHAMADEPAAPARVSPPPRRGEVAAPTLWASAIGEAAGLIDGGAVEDAVTIGWLKASSGWGFMAPPAPRDPGPPTRDGRVRLDDDAGLHWRPLRQGPLAVGCNGHVTCVDDAAGALALLQALAAGRPVDARQAGETIDLLRFLAAAGALVEVEP